MLEDGQHSQEMEIVLNNYLHFHNKSEVTANMFIPDVCYVKNIGLLK